MEEGRIKRTVSALEIGLDATDDDIDRFNSGVWLGEKTNKSADASDEMHLSSQTGAALNLVNCAIGAGIVGLPYAMAQTGALFGVPLLAIVCYLTHHAIMVLVRIAHSRRVSTYQDLAQTMMGRTGFVLLSLAQFILPFGTLCAYGIIVGDYLVHLKSLTGIEILGSRTFVILASTLLLMLPLSLYTNMAKLEKFSLVSVLSVLFIIVAIVVRAPFYKESITISSSWVWGYEGGDVFMAVGVMTHAFVCHHNMFLVYDSLRSKSPARFEPVSRMSCLSVLLLNCGIALAGYLNFREQSESNILNNFNDGADTFIDIARVAFSLNVVVTFPTQVLVARLVVNRALFPGRAFTMGRHVIVTLTIVFVAVIIALCTEELGEVLELNGSVAATTVAFIFPALFALCADGCKGRHSVINYGMLGVGISVMSVKLVYTVAGLLN